MQWHLSLTDRNMVYLPEDLQRELGVRRPARLVASVDQGRLIIELSESVSQLAGSLKKDR